MFRRARASKVSLGFALEEMVSRREGAMEALLPMASRS